MQNPLVVTRAEDAIRSILISKGYEAATSPDGADFEVDFTIGSKERTDVDTYPGTYAGAGWAAHSAGGSCGAGSISTDVTRRRAVGLTVVTFVWNMASVFALIPAQSVKSWRGHED